MAGLLRRLTVTLTSLIGYSAMAEIVGGGGVGDLAIRFGYYRYETNVMIVTVVNYGLKMSHSYALKVRHFKTGF